MQCRFLSVCAVIVLSVVGTACSSTNNTASRRPPAPTSPDQYTKVEFSKWKTAGLGSFTVSGFLNTVLQRHVGLDEAGQPFLVLGIKPMSEHESEPYGLKWVVAEGRFLPLKPPEAESTSEHNIRFDLLPPDGVRPKNPLMQPGLPCEATPEFRQVITSLTEGAQLRVYGMGEPVGLIESGGVVRHQILVLYVSKIERTQ